MHRKFALLIILALSGYPGLAMAQSGASPLEKLLAQLSSKVHNRTMEFGSYSDSVIGAYKEDPSSLASSLPQLRRNLDDPDPTVRAETLALIHAFLFESANPSVLLTVSDRVEQLLLQGDDLVRNMAMLTVADLRHNAPSQLVAPLFIILRDDYAADQTRVNAASTLMTTRPDDEAAEIAVIAAIENKDHSVMLRRGILSAAGNEFVGNRMLQKVISVATTPADKDLRDTAISTAENIGNRALIPLRAKLQAIAADPTEPDSSKKIASHALRISDRLAK